jgi:hypothetical protein
VSGAEAPAFSFWPEIAFTFSVESGMSFVTSMDFLGKRKESAQ